MIRWIGSVLVAAAVVVTARRRRSAPAAKSGPSRDPSPAATPPIPSGDSVRALAWHFAGMVTLICALVALTAVAAVRFLDVSSSPSPVEAPGKVLLYFDQPNVAALMDMKIDESSGSTLLHFGITAKDFSGDSVGFMIALVGNSRAATRYPNGEASEVVSGCWASGLTVHADSVECYTARLAPESLYAAPEVRADTQVITGRMTKDSGSDRRLDLWVSTDARYSVSAGKRTYFALPKIGTSYRPENLRGKLTIDLGRDQASFVPSPLDIVVNYRDLTQVERVDNVTPQPLTGRLTWAEVDASTVAASGSLVDTQKEERGQQEVFAIGIYAGFVASVLPRRVLVGYRTFRRLVAARRR
ncbi:hypothetical protein [Alloactinosynnema sp. L-07]|uniref:hypothetical protein n=1 Tax=Alloactinosynnema sp. L-07 TaxID=1653480 RepID=UPI0012F8A36E|nr:hypothetical protein [Alloactinosynnema sp. L-07]